MYNVDWPYFKNRCILKYIICKWSQNADATLADVLCYHCCCSCQSVSELKYLEKTAPNTYWRIISLIIWGLHFCPFVQREAMFVQAAWQPKIMVKLNHCNELEPQRNVTELSLNIRHTVVIFPRMQFTHKVLRKSECSRTFISLSARRECALYLGLKVWHQRQENRTQLVSSVWTGMHAWIWDT